MNDIEVLRRVRAGNTKAYEELVVKYEKRIFQVALGLLRDEQDALDATQEVFIKAFLRVANFRHESEYYTYLFRIAVNELRQALYEEMLGLEEPFRQAVLLRSVYQLSYERIAAETDTDIGTVKSRIYRGRERIRKNLAARNLL